MADQPNFGLLQPAAAPQMQVINRPDVALQNSQGLLQGVQQGSEMAARNQQMAIAQKELAMKQAAQPGLLAGQQISNQGGVLANQKAAQDIAMQKYQQQQHMNDIQVYSDAQKKGASPEAALDAMQQSMIAHDPTSALAMGDARQKLKDQIQAGNVKAVTDSGNLVHAIINSAQEQGKQPLDTYTAAYKQIKKQDPDAPDPESFKGNNQAFMNSYAVPTMATALPVAKQMALDNERAKDDKLYAAQSLVKQTTNDMQMAINNHGANSEEARAASSAAQQAQQAVRALPGQGIMGALTNKVMGAPGAAPGGIMGAIGNMFSGNGQPGTAGQGAPAVAPPAAPTAPAIPQGRVAVKAPDGTIGHIPAAQLQDALKAGYSQAQGQ